MKAKRVRFQFALFLALCLVYGFSGLAVNAEDIAQGEPEIQLSGVVNGGFIRIGSVAVGSQVTKTISIWNWGDADLEISGLPLTITGNEADQFSIIGQPATTVIPNGRTDIEILFAPTSGGVKNGAISFTNNDSDESPFSFRFRGTAFGATKGQPDFNNDGKVDILLRNYTHGSNQIWLMDGGVKTGSAQLPRIANVNWHFQCTGDFDGDGEPDIFLREFETGANQIWIIRDARKAGFGKVPAIPDTDWRIEVAEDFNNDGEVDILMRNVQYGTNQVWFLDGVRRTGSVMLPRIPDLNWRFEGVGDFNNDNKPDILMRNYEHGMNQVWYMDGTTKIGSAMLPRIPDLGWRFEGVADFNGDGKPDILMRNYTHGMNQVWFMDGVTKIGSRMLNTIPDVSWHIEN